jgi:hypothetical protein
MGLQLPAPLASLLTEVGYEWPQADEEKLFQMGKAWFSFGDKMREIIDEAEPHAESVPAANQGKAIDNFAAQWKKNEGPLDNLEVGSYGAQVVGAGLMVAAAVVLFQKIKSIIQLTILLIQKAWAYAMATPTFGASLAQIPIFQQICRMVLQQLVGMATKEIMGSQDEGMKALAA